MTPVSYHSNPLELVKPAFNGFKLNFKTFLLLILVVIGFVVGIAAVVGILFFVAKIVGIVIGALVGTFVLISYLSLPYYRLLLANAKQQPVSIREIMQPNLSLAWKLFGTTLLAGIIIAVGFILIIVPGIIFAGWLSYVSYVVLEEGLTGTAALGRSRELAKDHFVETYGVFGLNYVPQILSIIPVVGGVVATLVALPFGAVLPLRYLELKALKESNPTEVPKRSGWNWGLIVIGFVIVIITEGVAIHNRPMNSTDTTGNSVFTNNSY